MARRSMRRSSSTSNTTPPPCSNARQTPSMHVVARCCRLKADVVEQDERDETGRRAVLNFGHTFAHAFETLSWQISPLPFGRGAGGEGCRGQGKALTLTLSQRERGLPLRQAAARRGGGHRHGLRRPAGRAASAASIGNSPPGCGPCWKPSACRWTCRSSLPRRSWTP